MGDKRKGKGGGEEENMGSGGGDGDRKLGVDSTRKIQDLLNQCLDEMKASDETVKSNAEAVVVNAASIKASGRKISENIKNEFAFPNERIERVNLRMDHLEKRAAQEPEND